MSSTSLPVVPEVDELNRLYPLAELRHFVPKRKGKVCSIGCIFRWAQLGLKGRKLRVTQVGGTKMASRADLAAFFAALSGQTDQAATPSNGQREKAIADASRELEQAGI